MAITYFGYWEVGEAIKSILSALVFRDGNVMVLHAEATIPGGRVINIRLDSRDDQDVSNQAIAGGHRKSLRAIYTIDIFQSSVDETEAERLRNRMLEEIEVELTANRTLNGTVATSELGGVTLVTEKRARDHWSGAALRLICDKTITTQ